VTGGGALLARVMEDDVGIHERLERERSRMTHQVFLLAESGAMPDETERRSRARAATARAWMTHIGASIEPAWPQAPADLGTSVEDWFATNGERLEIIELELARRIAAGPIDDSETRARRVDLGAAARWLGDAIGAICDPDGDGGPAFARRLSAWLDGQNDTIAQLAAEGRIADPDDAKVAESAELFAHVRITVAGFEALLPGAWADPAPPA
jgi:hypothetical protein